jgi:putative ABC transport system ATP-binding protein
MSGDGEILLEADRVGRRADDGSWLLRDAGLVLRGGDRVGLVGASGAGKSVLLRTLALLDPLDEGEVRFRGRRVHGHDVPRFRSRVIYVHQRAPLFEGDVEQNLARPFRLQVHRQAHRTFDRARALALLARFGRDEDFLGKDAHELSGGEGQIVALVRVLLLDPEVLLLDEATASLDPDGVARAEAMIHDWVDERSDHGARSRALVWVGHQLEQVARLTHGAPLRLESGRPSGAPAPLGESP